MDDRPETLVKDDRRGTPGERAARRMTQDALRSGAEEQRVAKMVDRMEKTERWTAGASGLLKTCGDVTTLAGAAVSLSGVGAVAGLPMVVTGATLKLSSVGVDWAGKKYARQPISELKNDVTKALTNLEKHSEKMHGWLHSVLDEMEHSVTLAEQGGAPPPGVQTDQASPGNYTTFRSTSALSGAELDPRYEKVQKKVTEQAKIGLLSAIPGVGLFVKPIAGAKQSSAARRQLTEDLLTVQQITSALEHSQTASMEIMQSKMLQLHADIKKLPGTERGEADVRQRPQGPEGSVLAGRTYTGRNPEIDKPEANKTKRLSASALAAKARNVAAGAVTPPAVAGVAGTVGAKAASKAIKDGSGAISQTVAQDVVQNISQEGLQSAGTTALGAFEGTGAMNQDHGVVGAVGEAIVRGALHGVGAVGQGTQQGAGALGQGDQGSTDLVSNVVSHLASDGVSQAASALTGRLASLAGHAASAAGHAVPGAGLVANAAVKVPLDYVAAKATQREIQKDGTDLLKQATALSQNQASSQRLADLRITQLQARLHNMKHDQATDQHVQQHPQPQSLNQSQHGPHL